MLLCFLFVSSTWLEDAFEVAEFKQRGHIKHVMDVLEHIENSLLFWIPLAGACCMMILMLVKFLALLVKNCSKCKKKKKKEKQATDT